MVLLVCAASLATCLWLVQKQGLLAFYLMPPRAWQFALGGLVSFCVWPQALRQKRVATMLAASGLVATLIAAICLDERGPYPDVWSLAPSLGTALLLVGGAWAPSNCVTAALAGRLPQFLGGISYALYLWHWPVLLLGAQMLPEAGLVERLSLMVLALVLAVITTMLIERPIRRQQWLLRRPEYGLIAAMLLMATAHFTAFGFRNQVLTALQQPENLQHLQARSDVANIYRMGCDDWYHSADVHPCSFGQKTAARKAVIIGDSIALQWFPALAAIFDRPDWQLIAITKSSCPMVDASIFYDRIGREYSECARWREDAIRWISTAKPDIVIFGSRYTH